MRFFFVLLLCASLYSCNTTSNNESSADEDTAATNGPANESANENTARTGKLYIQSSIVNGLQVYWLWLGDDGTFVAEPKFGADPINYAKEKQANPAGTGRYTQNGNTISVTYDNGKTENWQMEYLGDRLNTIDGYFVTEPEKMSADFKLDGKYAASTSTNNVYAIRTVSFRNDGTFSNEQETFTNTEDAGGNATGSSTGTYKVYGNTLKLTFPDGETATSVIGVYQSGGNDFLVINNKLFK